MTTQERAQAEYWADQLIDQVYRRRQGMAPSELEQLRQTLLAEIVSAGEAA